jgi:hypothetical protein
MKSLTLLLVLSGALPLGAARIDSIAFNPSSTTVTVGETLHLEIDIGQLTPAFNSQFQGLSDLYAWSLEVDFDPTIFQALDLNEGAFLPATGATNFFPGLIDNNGGSIGFVSDSLSGAAVGADATQHGGSLVIADFQAIATSSGSTFSIAPGSCFQDSLDISTFGCTISGWLDTSTTARVAVTAPAPAPEPGSAAMAALGMVLIGCSMLLSKRGRSGAPQ